MKAATLVQRDAVRFSGGILRCSVQQRFAFMRKVFCLLALAAAMVFLPSAANAQETSAVTKLPLAELQKLADAGDPAAQNELGIRYRLGSDVEKDPAKAIPWYLKAAKQGFAKAFFNLGAAYYNGDGVAVNDSDSCVWFMLAADAGDPRGQEAVDRVRHEGPPSRFTDYEVYTASAYLRGELVAKDYGKAMKWLTDSANAGSGFAAANLAHMYDKGFGVPQDKEQGFKWLRRAAELKFAPAMYELGRASELGQGTPQSLPAAKKLYEQAAALGSPEALVALGAMYAEGRSVKGDGRKALIYFIAASYLGDPEGRRRADELAAGMSSKQVAAAQEEAKRVAVALKPLGLTQRLAPKP